MLVVDSAVRGKGVCGPGEQGDPQKRTVDTELDRESRWRGEACEGRSGTDCCRGRALSVLCRLVVMGKGG